MQKTEYKETLSIASANDLVRKNTQAVGWLVTPGVLGTIKDQAGLYRAIKEFNAFNDSNDPYREHDFGALKFEGCKVFWKIDYYDQSLQGWCDPSDPNCNRVLTIMLADEY
jgi:hypothetical protein